MKKFLMSGVFSAGIFSASLAFAACPNASPTVTVPLTGSAQVTVYDQGCNVLPGTGASVNSNPGGVLNGSTTPAVTGNASGLLFSANGASPGNVYNLTITYAGKTATMTATINAPVTAISLGTTTP